MERAGEYLEPTDIYHRPQHSARHLGRERPGLGTPAAIRNWSRPALVAEPHTRLDTLPSSHSRDGSASPRMIWEAGCSPGQGRENVSRGSTFRMSSKSAVSRVTSANPCSRADAGMRRARYVHTVANSAHAVPAAHSRQALGGYAPRRANHAGRCGGTIRGGATGSPAPGRRLREPRGSPRRLPPGDRGATRVLCGVARGRASDLGTARLAPSENEA